MLWTRGVEWVKVLRALGLLCIWLCFFFVSPFFKSMITSIHNSSMFINYCFSPFQWTIISIQWPSVQITTRHSLSQTKPGYKCSLKFYLSSHTLLWIKTILQNPLPAQASTWHGSPLTHLLYMESFLDIASPIEQGNTASWYYLILVFSIQYWVCNFPWLLPLQQDNIDLRF